MDAENAAFATGVEASVLMESAGRQMAEFVFQNHASPGFCIVFAGKGHNGGDVLVAARHLASAGWSIHVVLPNPSLAPLTDAQLRRIPVRQEPVRKSPLVVLDGLLGIGAQGDPRGPVASAIHEINKLRKTCGAWVLAADLPSGLDADTGKPGTPCVQADATLAIGFAKTGLVSDAATHFVGRLAVADLEELQEANSEVDNDLLIRPTFLRAVLPPRSFDTHKGLAGRVAVVAGSSRFPGAARLCSAGAVAGGAGLVTLIIKKDVYPVLAPSVIPEVMVRQVESYEEILTERWDAIGIGPGLSTQARNEITSVVRNAKCPCVVDAEALNALASSMDVLNHCAGPRLLTPHPGEMEGLSPRQDRSRRAWMQDFVRSHPVTLLLKGARTIIGEVGKPVSYNTTGHPGMATGGMGDVLTGVLCSLLAQGLSPYDAAMSGAWVCGRAAELAISSEEESQESLRATHVLLHVGRAFSSLRTGSF